MSAANGDNLDCIVGQSELAELRRDKARLDWLETKSCWIGVHGEFELKCEYTAGGCFRDTIRATCDEFVPTRADDRSGG
jgi:hypothetical protein